MTQNFLFYLKVLILEILKKMEIKLYELNYKLICSLTTFIPSLS
jgi:hypothetical protein